MEMQWSPFAKQTLCTAIFGAARLPSTCRTNANRPLLHTHPRSHPRGSTQVPRRREPPVRIIARVIGSVHSLCLLHNFKITAVLPYLSIITPASVTVALSSPAPTICVCASTRTFPIHRRSSVARDVNC
ncbi:hypothetical protein C8R44DRAFT_991714 [Mycena epipterygia]|nr:hypothetical protein C8R44DRAFT_991714 [Mycena epipterygia]